MGAAHNRATIRNEGQAEALMEDEVICMAELQLAGQLASTREGPHYVSTSAKSQATRRACRSGGFSLGLSPPLIPRLRLSPPQLHLRGDHLFKQMRLYGTRNTRYAAEATAPPPPVESSAS